MVLRRESVRYTIANIALESIQSKIFPFFSWSANGMLSHLCCDRKSRAACAQSFAPWQQATIQSMCRNLSYYCLLAPPIHIFVFRPHPVRGDWWITQSTQHHRRGCNNISPFYNEPHRSHVLCVKAELGTSFTSWLQHHFVAIGNPERPVRKASHHGSKQQ